MRSVQTASNDQYALSKSSGKSHCIVVITLLLAGIAVWCEFFGRANFLILGPWSPSVLVIFIMLVVAAVCVPAIRSGLSPGFDAIRHPSVKMRVVWSIAWGVVCAAYLLITARQQGRWLTPYLHDEFSYLIQAHQLAKGRLWMPEHPLANFFDSFQLIVRPVYASAYFPGTALLYVPGIWLHLPPWVTSVIISASVAALLYRIINELLDGVAGAMAVLLLISCQLFRELSFMAMGQLPLLLFGLMATLAWMKWRANSRRRWLIMLGLMFGLAGITRPVDALCFIIPIGLGFLADLIRRDRPLHAVMLVLSGITPLLLLQVILNFGVTGHFFQTPFRFYADRDYPNSSYGFHPFDATARPASDLPQKQVLYREEYLPLIEQHQPGNVLTQIHTYRLPLMLSFGASTPFPLLIVFLPAALAGLSRPRAAVLLALPLFLGLYVFYPFFLVHYVVAVLPAVIAGILIGQHEMARCLGSARNEASLALALVTIGLAIAALPQFDSTLRDEMFDAPLIRDVDAKLSVLDNAVVLFRYDAKRNVHEEPVYNADVAWPDDTRVIRAHDRGARNSEIFSYYAQHQPTRDFYLFDEADAKLTHLGSAADLAQSTATK